MPQRIQELLSALCADGGRLLRRPLQRVAAVQMLATGAITLGYSLPGLGSRSTRRSGAAALLARVPAAQFPRLKQKIDRQAVLKREREVGPALVYDAKPEMEHLCAAQFWRNSAKFCAIL